MDKLIISCCVHDEEVDHPMFPAETLGNMPRGMEEVAESVRQARDAGAAVAHVHQVRLKKGVGPEYWDREAYLELNRLIRQTDIIYEHRGANPTGGSAGARLGTYGEDPAKVAARRQELQQIKDVPLPDAVHVIAGAQHMDWGKVQHYVMPILAELETYMQHLRTIKVKPHLECTNALSFYNIRWLADRGSLDTPYWLDLAMGTAGSTYPPANIEELLSFTKKLPEHSVWHTWYMAPPKGTLTPQEGLVFLTHAIALGGHVRFGMEDTPYYWDGSLVKSNAQLIERVVRIARDIGREVATPDEARQMLGLPPRRK